MRLLGISSKLTPGDAIGECPGRTQSMLAAQPVGNCEAARTSTRGPVRGPCEAFGVCVKGAALDCVRRSSLKTPQRRALPPSTSGSRLGRGQPGLRVVLSQSAVTRVLCRVWRALDVGLQPALRPQRDVGEGEKRTSGVRTFAAVVTPWRWSRWAESEPLEQALMGVSGQGCVRLKPSSPCVI